MPKTADNYQTSITGRFPPLASTGGNDAEALENRPTQSLAKPALRKTMWAEELTAKWAGNPYEIHKRPPFRAHPFDTQDMFWVVGSTCVSVLHGWNGDKETAEAIADELNAACPAIKAVLGGGQ